jgi:hypothetical protein
MAYPERVFMTIKHKIVLFSIIFISNGLFLDGGMNYHLHLEKPTESQYKRQLNIVDGLFIQVGYESYIKPQILGTQTENWRYLVEKYFPAGQVDNALRVLFCESSGNSNAHNFSHRSRDDSWGLFQINRYGNLAKDRPQVGWLLVPENNIKYASELYKTHGWSPWKNCATKLWLL